MRRYLLSLDNGGTYIKAALLDTAGRQIGIAKQHNGVINLGDGLIEFDQEQLWETNCRCIREVLRETGVNPAEIACVGFAGQGKGLYMVDREGRCFRNAITSSDSRAEEYCRMWQADGTAERMFPKVFQYPVPGQTVPLLRWLKDHEPENYARIGYVFSMKDYLFYRLTGKPIAGKGSQSGTLLVNLRTQDYDPELLDAFGIPEMQSRLPELKWDTELCGGVSEEAAAVCGLCADTPVSAGMFDVDASALAMGVADPKDMFSIFGTCGVNGYISRTPVTNRSVSFNSLYSLEDTYLIEEGSNASSGVLEWVLKVLFNGSDEAAYQTVNAMVDVDPETDDHLVFLPSLTGFLHGGKGSIYSRGAWIGLSPEHDRAQMLRAVYEGVVFTHMIQLSHLLANRERPEKIRVAGGATGSRVWMQMYADALQIPVEIEENCEMGPKGVAIASAVATGIYPDIHEAVRCMTRPGVLIQPRAEYAGVYSRKFERFRKIMEVMDAAWPVLRDQ